jgi:hypothetical protein
MRFEPYQMDPTLSKLQVLSDERRWEVMRGIEETYGQKEVTVNETIFMELRKNSFFGEFKNCLAIKLNDTTATIWEKNGPTSF